MSLFDVGNDVLSALEDLRHSGYQSDYVAELIESAEQLATIATEEKSLPEKLRAVLRDENGLPPTTAATDVLVAVLFAVDRIDEKWEHPGGPSVTDYAIGISAFLGKRYGHE